MKQLNQIENKRQVHLAEYNNSWYKPGPSWKIAAWMLVSAIFFNNQWAVFNSLKCWWLRVFGAKVGERVTIKPSVNIKYPWLLQMGNHVWIGEKAWIDNLATVTIGNNVCISQGAFLLSGNHNYKKAAFDLVIGAITLEDGVWLGARSIVCGGVTCQSHSVLTVASVATKNLEPYGIYRGIPALKVKMREIQD